MITRSGGAGDILMIEPVLEALYYEYAPARIILRTECDWVLQDHPMVWKTLRDNYHGTTYGKLPTGLIQTDLNGLFDEPVTMYHFDMHEVIEQLSGLHGVETWAAVANTRLLRRTPSFGHYNFKSNGKTVVQLRKREDGRDLQREDLPMDLLGDAVFVEPGSLNPKELVDLIGGSELFIGSDSVGLHIAHAAGVRKIVGLYSNMYPHTLRAYRGILVARNRTELTEKIKIALGEAKYPAYLNEGNAAEMIKNMALSYCRGHGLDVGSSRWELPGSIPIPSEDFRDNFNQGPFDYIFSSHCLEHIAAWQEELKLWESHLKPGGICLMYLPHPRMEMWSPNGPWVGGEHKWAPSPVTLSKWINQNTSLRVEEYSCYPDAYWSFYILARRSA
jgi:SAM-dependent methyltransferase